MLKISPYIFIILFLPPFSCPALETQPPADKTNIGTEKPLEPDSEEKIKISEEEKKIQEIIVRLQEIRSTLDEKKEEINSLQKQLKKSQPEEEQQLTEKQLEESKKALEKLNVAFEQVATGGIDIEAFTETPQQTEFDWKQELVLITKPLFHSLKDITEKPRKIEQLRAEIARHESLLKLTRKARQSIETIQQQPALPENVQEKLQHVSQSWAQRETDILNALEIARHQLTSMYGENVSPLTTIYTTLQEFFQERGITLAVVLLVIITIWMIMRFLLWMLWKIFRPKRERIKWQRLTTYGFQAITLLFGLFAVLIILYARNDLALLILVILGTLVILLNLRHILLRYLEEIQLLLDLGPVRQGERVIYNGVPYYVKTIRMYSTLVNPQLEGSLRLPPNVLNQLISRPYNAKELWFPCCPGEYVMLEGERFAKVLHQTVEMVQLKMMGSLVQISTSDFIRQPLRNLSREGFIVAVTFGIAYKHQAVCLSDIPQRFYQALTAAFAKQEEFGPALNELIVEFKEAGAHALNYLILVEMDGEAASGYFPIGRLIQKTCVEVCNHEQWEIPFNQLTIHPGEDFAEIFHSKRNILQLNSSSEAPSLKTHHASTDAELD